GAGESATIGLAAAELAEAELGEAAVAGKGSEAAAEPGEAELSEAAVAGAVVVGLAEKEAGIEQEAGGLVLVGKEAEPDEGQKKL
ncbi:hypothetical protein U1Q18_012818, partial [Sarracenia purpurea var. burkii]